MKEKNTNFNPIRASEKGFGVIAKMDWVDLFVLKGLSPKIIEIEDHRSIAVKYSEYAERSCNDKTGSNTILKDLISLVKVENLSLLSSINEIGMFELLLDQNKVEIFLDKHGLGEKHFREFFYINEDDKNEVFLPLCDEQIQKAYVGSDYHSFCLEVLCIYYCHKAASQLINVANNRSVSKLEMLSTKINLDYIGFISSDYSLYVFERKDFCENSFRNKEKTRFCKKFEVIQQNIFLEDPHNAADLRERSLLEVATRQLSHLMRSISPIIEREGNTKTGSLFLTQTTDDIFSFCAYQISLFMCYSSNTKGEEKKKITKLCDECGNPFIASHGREIYCDSCKTHIKTICARKLKEKKRFNESVLIDKERKEGEQNGADN